jgi:transcriptional regulator with XRE-family HTH domain
VTGDPWKAQLDELGALLRAERLAAGLSLRDLADRTKVSNAYLSQLERGLHEPSLRVLSAIADALAIPLGSLLARAGMIDAAPEGADAAIQQDPRLSEAQRFALLSVYRSFVPATRRGR